MSYTSIKMSSYKTNGNGHGNGRDNLNYIILKDLYLIHGSTLFKNGTNNSVIEIIMNYTFTEEDKLRAREVSENYEIAMLSAKLALASQKKFILNAIFDSIKSESAKNGKTIDTLLEEKITGQLALF